MKMAGNDMSFYNRQETIFFEGVLYQIACDYNRDNYIHIIDIQTYFNLLFVVILFSCFEAFKHMPCY